MIEKITYSEIYAFKLLQKSLATSITPHDYHEAGNEIILLAEKIKADRAVTAMTSGERNE